MNETVLKHYAHVLLEIGCNFQPGQTLLVNAAPKDYALVRQVTRTAYELGAKYVRTDYEDTVSGALRCLYSREEYLDYYPDWVANYLEQSAADDICQLWLDSPDPYLNAELDADKVNRIENSVVASKAGWRKSRADGHICSCRACVPSEQWAAAVYPGVPAEEGLARLWNDIIHVCRLDHEDPVQAWRDHKAMIRTKKEKLNALDLRKLFFTGPGTDLEIGLVEHGTWVGGNDVNEKNRLEYVPNIPTEEIFFVPHKYQINGTVTATLPLNHNGVVIEGLCITAKDGKVVSYSATRGEKALRNIVEYDAGSCYFGEISLVSVQSPIYRLGKIFYTTLLDENAVCHIALGNGLVGAVPGGSALNPEQRDKAGINVSQLHVDFMIGSDKICVEGLTRSGERVCLMQNGDWAI